MKEIHEGLEMLREVLLKKQENMPDRMSGDEYADWRRSYDGECYMYKNLISIWRNCTVSSHGPVVIKKKNRRTGGWEYLVFKDEKCFAEYGRSCELLGGIAYGIFEEMLVRKMRQLIAALPLGDAVFDRVQELTERSVGLYFEGNADESDEEMKAHLYDYMEKIVVQKVSDICAEYGKMIYIDAFDGDFLKDSDAEIKFVMAEEFCDDINIEELSVSVYNYIDKCGTNFDIKDNLMPMVIMSENAVCDFLKTYYDGIENRNAIWRPVALMHQTVYSFEKGTKYLKNPEYIRACKDVTLREMIEKHSVFLGKDADVADKINKLAKKAEEKGIAAQKLSECADSTEQIGKAMSKELRTQEALRALSKALAISAIEADQNHISGSGLGKRGEEYDSTY